VSIRCEQEGGGDEEEKEWETKLEKGTPTAMVGRKKEGRVGDGGERHDLRALLVVVEALYGYLVLGLLRSRNRRFHSVPA